MENLYLTLGVSQGADDEEIMTAYESLYLFYHSDEYQSTYADIDIKLANIAVSYEILKCATKRKSYDEMWQHYQAEKSLDAIVDIPQMDYEFEVDITTLEQWSEAVKLHPQLNELYDNLAALSNVLAFSFKAYILESQRFEESERLAYIMCAQYIQRFFDEEQSIKPLAKGLLVTNSPSKLVTVDELFIAQGIEVDTQVDVENKAIAKVEAKFKQVTERDKVSDKNGSAIQLPEPSPANIEGIHQPIDKIAVIQRLLSKEARAERLSSKKATAKGSLILLGLFLASNLAA